MYLLQYKMTPSPSYLLTPWCRVLLEKLTGLQPVKKFPAFHGTRRFITALTSVHHLSLSWASPIQSIYPHHTSWRSVLTPSPSQSLIFRKATCTEHDCTVTPPSPLQFVKSSLSAFKYAVLQSIHLFLSHLI